MANRYINASELSVILLKGAFLYGEYMNTTTSSPASKEQQQWMHWADNHSDSIVEKAKGLQDKAFNLALGD